MSFCGLDVAIVKGLADHFFALLPQRLSIGWVERIGSYSFGGDCDGDVVWNDVADMAVLAVAAANFIRWSNRGGPHGSRGALRNRLQSEGCLALCGKLLVDLGDHRFKAAGIGVAGQFGPYTARMYGGGAHTAFTVPVIEGNGEENVCCL